MKQDVQPRLLTIVASAQYCGVSKRVIEHYIQEGQLRTYRLPALNNGSEYLRKTLIEREELDRLIERGLRI